MVALSFFRFVTHVRLRSWARVHCCMSLPTTVCIVMPCRQLYHLSLLMLAYGVAWQSLKSIRLGYSYEIALVLWFSPILMLLEALS